MELVVEGLVGRERRVDPAVRRAWDVVDEDRDQGPAGVVARLSANAAKSTYADAGPRDLGQLGARQHRERRASSACGAFQAIRLFGSLSNGAPENAPVQFVKLIGALEATVFTLNTPAAPGVLRNVGVADVRRSGAPQVEEDRARRRARPEVERPSAKVVGRRRDRRGRVDRRRPRPPSPSRRSSSPRSRR